MTDRPFTQGISQVREPVRVPLKLRVCLLPDWYRAASGLFGNTWFEAMEPV